MLLIGLFIAGLILQFFGVSTISKLAGLLCQLFAFIFTALPVFVFRNEENQDIPVDHFVDRKELIEYVFTRLDEILEGQSYDRFIEIQCGTDGGIGKTELLKEIKHLIKSKESAIKFFGMQNFNNYKSVYSKIGRISLLSWESNRTNNLISSYPRTLFKHDLFLVDDVPISIPFEISKNDIVVFTSKTVPANSKAAMPYVLEPLKHDDIQVYYNSVYNRKLTDSIIKKIENYSHGNVSIIKKIIDNPKALESFIEDNYDLHTIEELIKVGDYPNARTAFNKYVNNEEDVSLTFNQRFLSADLMHLENRYEECMAEFINMLSEFKDSESQRSILERIAHVLKHQSKFDESLETLEKIDDFLYRAEMSISTDIMAFSFYENDYYYHKFLEDLLTIENLSNSLIDEESYLTYRAIRSAYSENKERAVSEIDYAISHYEKTMHRRVYNCLFIKGEILRRFSEYREAFECYQECIIAYKFNNDFDLYAMASIMMHYTNLKSNTKRRFDELLSFEEILSICHEKDIPYIEKLCKKIIRINNALIKKDKALSEQAYFDKYLFLIP